MRMTRAAGGLVVLATLLACSRGPSPTQVYVSYRQAFDKARTVEEVGPFMDKATLARVQATPPEQRARSFEFVKAFGEVVDVTVVKETVTGETATVEATGVSVGEGKDQRAAVEFVKEDGAWKIKSEKWPADASAPASPPRTCPQL